MSGISREAVGGKRYVSLREGFIATFLGNAAFAGAQWATLALIARLGNATMLGEYALAVAIATPILMFSHLNLRAVLATDMERSHPFGDYLAVRAATALLGVAAVAGVGLAGGYEGTVVAVIVAAGVVLAADNVSDIYYAAMQRRERMDQIARSMTVRAVLSLAAMGVTLWLTGSLLAAVAAQAAGRFAVLVAYDRPVGCAGESMARTGLSTQLGIVGVALPLGVVLMLLSAAASLPRYTIQRDLGMAALGAFAAPASFMGVGATLVNALGQAATPRLARYFSQGEGPRFLRLALQYAGIAFGLGVAGIAVALAMGRFWLRVMYGPAYGAQAGLLVWMMVVALASNLAGALGYIMTAARQFRAQAPLFAVVAAGAGISAWLLVPRMGLEGGAAALGIASIAQGLGSLWILRSAWRKRPVRAHPGDGGDGMPAIAAQVK
jgi:O-antigen/teichoic acid export membrane protein